MNSEMVWSPERWGRMIKKRPVPDIMSTTLPKITGSDHR
jgi:hypothetical protein